MLSPPIVSNCLEHCSLIISTYQDDWLHITSARCILRLCLKGCSLPHPVSSSNTPQRRKWRLKPWRSQVFKSSRHSDFSCVSSSGFFHLIFEFVRSAWRSADCSSVSEHEGLWFSAWSTHCFCCDWRKARNAQRLLSLHRVWIEKVFRQTSGWQNESTPVAIERLLQTGRLVVRRWTFYFSFQNSFFGFGNSFPQL